MFPFLVLPRSRRCILAIFILLICSSPLLGQHTQDAYVEILKSHFQEQNFEQILTFADSIIQLPNIQSRPKVKAEILNIKGNTLRRMGRLEEALQIHRSVLATRKIQYGASSLEVANSLHNIGNCWLNLEQPGQAKPFLEQALKIKEALLAPSDDALVAIHISLATYYQDIEDYPKAEDKLQKALAIRRAIPFSQSDKIIAILINYGNFLLDQQKHEKALPLFEEALDSLQHKRHKRKDLLPIALMGKADCLKLNGQLTTALEDYEKAIDLFNHLKTSPLTKANCFEKYGSALLMLGDFQQAVIYFNQSIALLSQNQAFLNKSLTDLYDNLGLSYRYLKQFDRALTYHEKAINIYLAEERSNHPVLAGFYSNMGKCYWEMRAYDAAEYYFGEALSIQRTTNENAVQIVYSLIHLGNCHFQLGRYDEAIKVYEEALQNVKINKLTDKPSTQLPYLSLAQCYNQMGNPHKAISYSEKAWQILSNHDFQGQFLYQKAWAITIKSQSLLQIAQRKKSLTAWEAALKSFESGLDMLHQIQHQYKAEESALYLREDFYALFEGLVISAFELGHFSITYYDLAFQYAEQYKAYLLKRSIKADKVKKVLGLPNELIAKEKQIQQQLYNLSRLCQIEEEKGLFAEQSKLNSWYQGQLTLNKQLLSIQQQIKNASDNYSLLDVATEPISVDSLQQQLLPKQSMISYFVGDGRLFYFVIRNDTFFVTAMAKPEGFEKELIDWYYLLTARPDAHTSPDEAHQRFTDLAHQFYASLIMPVADELREELIIIPDGLLFYIPFEALIQKQPKYPLLFGSHDYLIRSHSISYLHAADMLLAPTKPGRASKGVLGFAPSFIDDPRGLRHLEYNNQEVASISRLYRGDTYIGDEATKQLFIENASNYQLLHFATHSVLDQSNPSNSFLAFAAKAESLPVANMLFLYEVYGLTLNADIAILSACQTRIGEYHRGEGTMSLARAFTSAGAKSVLASLWSIDDQQTHQLMIDFYHAINEGLKKNDALRAAKIKYLEEASPESTHPYYWAALTINGNMEAIATQKRGYFFYLLLIIPLALLIWYAKKHSFFK